MKRVTDRGRVDRGDRSEEPDQPIRVRNLHRPAFRQQSTYIVALASEPFQSAARSAACALTGPPTEPATWRRGLILSHSHLGDVLYRTCSLPALAEGLPLCKWSFLTTPHSAPLLARNPAVHETLPLLGNDGAGLTLKALDGLRRRRFDVVLCTNIFRGVNDLLLSVRLRAPNRVAYGFKGFSGLATLAVQVEYPAPYPAYIRDMVAAVTGASPTWPLRPRVYLTGDHHDRALAVLHSLGVGDHPFIVCAPGTRQRSGGSPPELFVNVLRTLSTRFQGTFVLCGDTGERALLDTMRERVGARAHVLAGELDVLGFAAMLTYCALAFTQDSGPRHLANAAGVPVAFFRNLAVPRSETGPYCDTEVDLFAGTSMVASAAASHAYAGVDADSVAETLLNMASTTARTSSVPMSIRHGFTEERQRP